MCVYIYIFIVYIYIYIYICLSRHFQYIHLYIYIFRYIDIFYVIILHYYVSIVLDDSICLKETSHCLSHAFSNQLAGSS